MKDNFECYVLMGLSFFMAFYSFFTGYYISFLICLFCGVVWYLIFKKFD